VRKAPDNFPAFFLCGGASAGVEADEFQFTVKLMFAVADGVAASVLLTV
jgi:hypothetical protein